MPGKKKKNYLLSKSSNRYKVSTWFLRRGQNEECEVLLEIVHATKFHKVIDLYTQTPPEHTDELQIVLFSDNVLCKYRGLSIISIFL